MLFSGIFFGISFAEKFEYEVEIEIIAENLNIPWAIDFAPDGRIFFTERSDGEIPGTTRHGTVRIIEDGKLLDEPALTLQVERREAGVLGIALDPNFDENHYVYVYYTKKSTPLPKDILSDTFNRLSRFTESNNKLENEFILIDRIPGSTAHDGGRIKIGPDGKLYATTGEIKTPELSQDLNSLGGKILRINLDGSIPNDNPFENSPVFSYGHRNPQGIDWDKSTGNLISTEHGPSGEYGWEGRDEINLIESGKNYGWPNVSGELTDAKYVTPLYQTGQEETWAPSGATFYNSEKFPDWQGKFFVATLYGKHLRILDFDLDTNEVLSNEILLKDSFGRLRDVAEGPDGNLYVLTSNQDGRGIPAPNDDRIFKIIPISSNKILLGDNTLSPLQQFKQGVLSKNILCKDGLELLIKNSSGMPACVTTKTLSKLIEIGWGNLP
ncbi:MAG: PQQ-dependent sugar dehydrogenase [Nitrosopumilus sp.]|nr:PQQ-dependent sugar dehydrogenase [Nitrosopumilus sp.]